jgi:hypothetical protein
MMNNNKKAEINNNKRKKITENAGEIGTFFG